ncbi:MAG: hypothetical protein ACTHZX_02440, partial [Microbacterium sp.]
TAAPAAPVAEPSAPAADDPPSAGAPASSTEPEEAPPHSGGERPAEAAPAAEPEEAAPLTLDRLSAAWSDVTTRLTSSSAESAAVVSRARVAEVQSGDVLLMSFPSAQDMGAFKGAPADDLRTAIHEVLGVRVRYRARVDPPAPADDAPPPDDDPEPGSYADAYARPADAAPREASAPASVTGWSVAAIPAMPGSGETPGAAPVAAPGGYAPPAPPEPEPVAPEPPAEEPATPEPSRPSVQRRQVNVPDGVERRGEAVVRQILGATFLHEEPHEQPTRFA